MVRARPICMVQVQSDYRGRIARLQALIASERVLVGDPVYGIPAARVIAEARRELAILKIRGTQRFPSRRRQLT